jgi:hypothetical protein
VHGALYIQGTSNAPVIFHAISNFTAAAWYGIVSALSNQTLRVTNAIISHAVHGFDFVNSHTLYSIERVQVTSNAIGFYCSNAAPQINYARSYQNGIGLRLESFSFALIHDSAFYANDTGISLLLGPSVGGGSANFQMINCTVDGNGQGILIGSSNPAAVNLQNLLVTHNGYGIFLDPITGTKVELTLDHCDSWGNDTNYFGFTVPTNCISLDPLYQNLAGTDGLLGTADDDFSPSSISPCIDAGNNNYVLNGPFFDLNSHPRLIDDPWTTDHGVTYGTAPTVDIGACEFQPPLRLVSLTRSNSWWILNYPSASGHSYQPQFTTNFLTWNDLAAKVTGNGTVQSSKDTGSNSFRFYRVIQDP